MASENGQLAELREKVKWLMVLRVVIVTLLLGTSVILQIGDDRNRHPAALFSGLIAGTYFLTILYSLLLHRVRNLRGYIYVQLFFDLLLETVLVASTGGIDSPFSPFYIITILSGGILLDRKSGILAGAVAGAFFGATVDVQYFKLISGLAPNPYSGMETLYLFFLNMVAYLTVAYLGGSLAENLRQTRERLVEKTAGLADLKAFHENVVRSISSGVMTADAQGRVTSLNRAAQEILGFTESEVVHRYWWDVLDAEDLREAIEGVTVSGRPLRLDRNARKKSGMPILLGMTVSPLLDSGGQETGAVWAFQDLTRIKEMEDEIKRKKWLATIGEMAAGIAHEIRNPLASISGAMQVINSDANLDRDSRYLMEIGLKESERLNGIITSFLHYTRPAPLNRKPGDLHRLLNETLDLLQKSPEWNDRIALVKSYSDEPFRLELDLDQMTQVFWNLGINAVQAMEAGGKLEVVTQRIVPKRLSDRMVRSDSPWIRIAFMDTGSGVPEEAKEKVFYPFFTTKDKGSGLGLCIVHRIIEDHGGRIHLDSTVGKGTTINLFLPEGEKDPSAGRSGREAQSGAKHPGR
jgi:two-component system sensor histidine kinase PilS (NtrC family)